MNRFYQKNGQLFRTRRFLCRIWIRFAFFLLFHGLRACAQKDALVQKEAERWRDGFTVAVKTSKNGPSLSFIKQNGRLFRIPAPEKADLNVTFKSLAGAFRVTTFRQGIGQAFAANQITMSGEVGLAMSLVHCMEEVELQLLPNVLSKRLLTKRRFDLCDHWTIYKALFCSIVEGKSGRVG